MENKKFAKEFEKRIKMTIRRYDLLKKNDKVIVACSGGKDSTTTLYLLKKFGYDVEALMIDLGMGKWSEMNLENIKKFSKDIGVKLHVVGMRKEFGYSICYIRSGIQSRTKLKNCMICGVIKRWVLNRKARILGATKIATGHNLDDECETILMNLFHGNPKLGIGMGPKIGITSNKKFVQRIKPLYFCLNRDVKRYSELMNFPVLYEPCPCSVGAFRRDVRAFINKMEGMHPDIKQNIVNQFLELVSEFRKNYRNPKKIKYCEICKEPSRNEICKACELIGILK